MTQKRTGQTWQSPEDYGRSLPPFTVNLIVSDLARSVEFYQSVMGAKIVYSDVDFAALVWNGLEFMLHTDHTYDHHAWHARLASGERRGLGVELRMYHFDPDALEKRATENGATILQTVQDKPHGWRDVIVADPDGYTWAVGVPH